MPKALRPRRDRLKESTINQELSKTYDPRPGQGVKRFPTTLQLRCLAGLIVGGLLLAVFPSRGFAQVPVRSGPLRVYDPRTGANLIRGGSGTEFGLLLPAGARCPGDSRRSYYFVFGYLVPLSVKPAEVRFDQLLPVQGYDLFYSNSAEPWGPVNTRPVTAQLPDLPRTFSWGRLNADLLIGAGQQSSTWNMSIACEHSGLIANYWSTLVQFVRVAADPRGFGWHIEGEPPSAGSGFPWGIAVPIALAVILASVSLVFRLRHRGTTPPPAGQEHQRAGIHV